MSFIGDTLDAILNSFVFPSEAAVARRSLVPGLSAVWDDCCVGQLTIRVVSIVPVGTPQCITGWRVTVGVSVVRCIAVVTDNGVAPAPEQITADQLWILNDMESIKDQLLALPGRFNVQRISLQQWAPEGAEGGCAGGEWTAVLLLPDCPGVV